MRRPPGRSSTSPPSTRPWTVRKARALGLLAFRPFPFLSSCAGQCMWALLLLCIVCACFQVCWCHALAWRRCLTVPHIVLSDTPLYYSPSVLPAACGLVAPRQRASLPLIVYLASKRKIRHTCSYLHSSLFLFLSLHKPNRGGEDVREAAQATKPHHPAHHLRHLGTSFLLYTHNDNA